MNSIIHLTIISIIVSLHECYADKLKFDVYTCHQNSVILVPKSPIRGNNPKSASSSNDFNSILQSKLKLDARFYQIRNRDLNAEINSENKEGIKETVKNTIEAPIILKVIQRGIQETIKLFSSTKKDSRFYEKKYDYVDIFSGKYNFQAFSPENFLNLRILYNNESDFKHSFNLPLAFKKQNTDDEKCSVFYTPDYKFVIKTITKKEQKALKTILFEYFSHFCKFPESLLPKISGLYYIQNKSVENYIIVMPNMYPQPLQIDFNNRFYLKGTDKEAPIREDKSERTFRLLDNNFIEIYPGGFIVPSNLHKSIKLVLENDCELLKKLKMTNYSLALVISPVKFTKNNHQVLGSSGNNIETKDILNQKFIDNHLVVKYNTKTLNIFIGFNNVLHKYDFIRQVEYLVKGTFSKSWDKVTLQEPQTYASRFMDFITKFVTLKNNF